VCVRESNTPKPILGIGVNTVGHNPPFNYNKLQGLTCYPSQ